MKGLLKIFVILILIVLLHSCTNQNKAVPFYKTIEENEKPIIAVLPFNSDIISKIEANAITILFETALHKTDLFYLIEQTQVNEILEIQEYSLSVCVDTKCAVKIGKLLSAEHIVLGDILKIGSQYYINAKIIDVQTGLNLTSEKVSCSSFEGLSSIVDSLAFKLVGFKYKEKHDNKESIIVKEEYLRKEEEIQIGEPETHWNNGSFAYIKDKNKIILYNGLETWEYDIFNQVLKNVSEISISQPTTYIHGFSFIYVGNSKAILFGGMTMDNICLNEMWEFNILNHTWTNITLLSKNKPEPRNCCSMDYIAKDKIILHGGESGIYRTKNFKTYQETWIYHINTYTWEKMKTYTPAGNHHALVTINETKCIMVPNWTQNNCITTYLYDVKKNRWKKLQNKGKQFPNRFGFSLAFNKDSNKIYLFGGALTNSFPYQHLNELLVFDITESSWQRIDFKGELVPSPRRDSKIEYVGNNKIILLCGGDDTFWGDGEIWEYNISLKKWIKIDYKIE